jgi:hypothetical protein
MSIKVGLIVAAPVNWWILSAAIVGAVLLVWFVVRDKPWRWPKLELVGYGTWALAGAMFAVPEIWASRDNNLPFPTLSGTIGHLERRWDIVALLVILVVTYALLQVIRVGAAVVATRVGFAEASVPIPAVATVGTAPGFGTPAPTVEVKSGAHVAVNEGRVTGKELAYHLGWGFAIAYLVCTCIVVAFSFLIPLWIHGLHATDSEKQLGGEIGYSSMALMFFIIPAALARFGVMVPFPSLFATVINLEHRSRIIAVLVAGCITFLTLHLVLYPYPSIIAWFVDLKNVHDHCAQHGTELICTGK